MEISEGCWVILKPPPGPLDESMILLDFNVFKMFSRVEKERPNFGESSTLVM
jgi:hypothetical protein